jgi:hypothetical protein
MIALVSSRTLQRFLRGMCSAIRLPGVGVRDRRHAPRLRSGASLLNILIVVGAAALSGCASAPIQEMSNARQTIRAAQDAGAAQYAPTPLSDAQSLLSEAETALHRREYRIARHRAMEAHDKATEALHTAEEHR